MPEHLRALVVILTLATVVFIFARAPACAAASTVGDFERRRNLWFAITLTAFLAHNFWVYIIVAAVLLIFFAVAREQNKIAMFFFLLFAVPPISADITGLGVVDHLFSIHYVRLLSLAVLFPAFLTLWRRPDSERFGRLLPDKFIIGYIVLIFFLQLTHNTFTNTLRHSVFYAFTDIFLPYYVASRLLRNLQGFRDALMAFVVAALVLSAIGAFEFAKRWLLYAALEDVLGARWNFSYLYRDGLLRAQGSTGQPIPLGYVITVAMGFLLYLRRSVPNTAIWGLGLLLLMLGLIAPVSRGPWVGAAALFLAFIAFGPSPGLQLLRLALLGAIIVPALLLSPVGDRIIDYLPFVGTVEERNVTYRGVLLERSYEVIAANPFFGNIQFRHSAALLDLWGRGILDVVNTYLRVAMESGLVGLSLFLGFFLAVAANIITGMRSVADKRDERYLLGRALLSTLLGIMIIIFTVSSITIIPVVYWAVAGLGVAYARMLALARAPEAARSARFQPAPMKIRT